MMSLSKKGAPGRALAITSTVLKAPLPCPTGVHPASRTDNLPQTEKRPLPGTAVRRTQAQLTLCSLTSKPQREQSLVASPAHTDPCPQETLPLRRLGYSARANRGPRPSRLSGSGPPCASRQPVEPEVSVPTWGSGPPAHSRPSLTAHSAPGPPQWADTLTGLSR